MSYSGYYFDRATLAELRIHSNHLGIHSSELTKLSDNIVEINNNVTGDASDGLRVYPFTHDSANGKARALFSDASHNLKVKDDDVITEITSLKNAQEVGTMDANNTRNIGDGQSVQTRMAMGYDNDNGKVRSIDVDSDGRINVNVLNNVSASGVSTESKQDDIVTKLDDIETLVTALNNGSNSHQNLYSNGSLAAHTFSTTIDMSNHRHLSLFGKTTSTSGTLYLALSTDNTNYYVATNLSTYVQVLNGVYYFGSNFANIGAKYVRVYSTTLLSDLYMSASMKN